MVGWRRYMSILELHLVLLASTLPFIFVPLIKFRVYIPSRSRDVQVLTSDASSSFNTSHQNSAQLYYSSQTSFFLSSLLDEG